MLGFTSLALNLSNGLLLLTLFENLIAARTTFISSILQPSVINCCFAAAVSACDPNDVVARSGEMVKAYQDSIINKGTQNQAEGGDGEQPPNKDRTMQDLSDQTENSPVIDKSRTDK